MNKDFLCSLSLSWVSSSLSKFLAPIFLSLFLISCANHAATNQNMERDMTQAVCSESEFDKTKEEMLKNKDVIYKGINSGLVARNCSLYERSIEFFDMAEESYKVDVDLASFGKKGAKLLGGTLLSDAFLDYDGTLYERIMVNVLKGLDFMAINDYANARVEFNRALARQDKAKEYFATQINKSREAAESKGLGDAYSKGQSEHESAIEAQYGTHFDEFKATANFVNPYATYLASVFFFMDKDYARAADLFKEVAALQQKDAEMDKQFRAFEGSARSVAGPVVVPQKDTKLKGKKGSKQALKAQKVEDKPVESLTPSINYVFVVYENGFGAAKDEFSITLPFYLISGITHSLVALPVLKKRDSSYPYIVANNEHSSHLVNLDDIVATEFKIGMPAQIAKAIASTLIKTTITAAVAKHDPTGGLLGFALGFAASATTKADVRGMIGLPKEVQSVLIPNTGLVSIKSPNGQLIVEEEVAIGKNVLLIVRSFAPHIPPVIFKIER